MRFTVRLPERLLERARQQVERGRFESRSEAIRCMMDTRLLELETLDRLNVDVDEFDRRMRAARMQAIADLGEEQRTIVTDGGIDAPTYRYNAERTDRDYVRASIDETGGWPEGDPCPDCGELMDVGAAGSPGGITWQECEECQIGWGPWTGFCDIGEERDAE